MLAQIHAKTGRPAFTLIELLVVISIIGVLVTLTAAAVFLVSQGQRGSNTELAMRATYKILERQWQAVIDKAGKETIPTGVLNMAGGSPSRARVIWKKLRLRQEFPMSYAEALTPSQNGGTYVTAGDLPAKKGYQSAFATAAGPDEVQSASCLLLALQQNRGGATMNADEIAAFIGDSNKDGIKELVDGWGNPLVFFRFPTGNAELDNLNPAVPGTRAAKYRDPLDPDGLLMDPSWNNTANAAPGGPIAVFEAMCYPIHVGSPSYQPVSHYILPTLVSMGNNGLVKGNTVKGLGLNLGQVAPYYDMSVLPAATYPTADNEANDNIYSFRLRLGARGD